MNTKKFSLLFKVILIALLSICIYQNTTLSKRVDALSSKLNTSSEVKTDYGYSLNDRVQNLQGDLNEIEKILSSIRNDISLIHNKLGIDAQKELYEKYKSFVPSN